MLSLFAVAGKSAASSMIDVFLDNLKVRLLAAGKIVRILPS